MAAKKKPQLDAATIEIVKRMLTTPPKLHDGMKIGRLPKDGEKKRPPKDRASSSKPPPA